MDLLTTKILHIDDEPEIRKMMRLILEDEVKEFYSAKNAQEAYDIYKEKKPDIILLDISMPYDSGIDFAKKVRKNDHSVKIIIITAHSDTEKLLLVTDLKLTKYIIKPFLAEQLFGALDQALKEIQDFTITNNKIIELQDSFTWNLKTKMLHHNHEVIKLTPKERKILEVLFTNLNTIVSYNTLLLKIWDDYADNHIDSLKTMMKNIRKKLPKNTIQNIYATGFKINI
ncbi:MAG: response regulator transcription factor [Arcobacteraceae bacterium]